MFLFKLLIFRFFYLIAKIQQKSERKKCGKGLLTQKERKGLRERAKKRATPSLMSPSPFIQS